MTRYNSSGSIRTAHLLLMFLLLAGTGKAQTVGKTAHGATGQRWYAVLRDTRLVEKELKILTDVMIRDITSPPVASRDYAYTLIAFYEAARPGTPSYKSFAGRLNGLRPLTGDSTGLPSPAAGLKYDWLIAGTAAFYKTAYAIVFSKEMFAQSFDSIQLEIYKMAIPKDVYNRSVKFGEEIAAAILKWAKADRYGYTRTLPRFTPGKDLGLWQQTAPDYMEAVEPYWNQIRTMVLQKPDQFLLPPPARYNSPEFVTEVREVYETSMHLTREQTAISNFWDCNPFATQTIGHLMYSIKKVSPGGHWIGITGVAIRKRRQDLVESLYSYSLVSIAMFDAIIACWDEKYRSNYIRPITAIQLSLSHTWQPQLQTPPFPEYPSGHSVISNAAAAVLTHLFGDQFNYTDDTEKPYGLPQRSFKSFYDAASEAAISRLYGGIHFRQAIENGRLMGRQVGDYVLRKLDNR
jgi:hypothetical protein